MVAPWVLDGPMNADAFLTYVTRVLVPELGRGDVVIPVESQSTGRARRHRGCRGHVLAELAHRTAKPSSRRLLGFQIPSVGSSCSASSASSASRSDD